MSKLKIEILIEKIEKIILDTKLAKFPVSEIIIKINNLNGYQVASSYIFKALKILRYTNVQFEIYCPQNHFIGKKENYLNLLKKTISCSVCNTEFKITSKNIIPYCFIDKDLIDKYTIKQNQCNFCNNECKASKCKAKKGNKLEFSPEGLVFPCASFKWLVNENNNGDLRPNIKDFELDYIITHDPLLRLLRCKENPLDLWCKVNCSSFKKCGGGCKSQKVIQNREKFILFLKKEMEIFYQQAKKSNSY